MSIYIGGWQPGFRFRLSSSPITERVINSSSTSGSTGQYIDTTRVITSYTNAVTGTQYNVQIIPEQFVLFGTDPTVNLISSNSGIAVLDQLNNVNFINSGNYNIIGSYDSNSYYAGQTVTLSLTNLSGGGNTNIATSYIGNPVTASGNVLVVYNTNSTDSTNLKTYYTGIRPQFSGANVLGINCVTTESIAYTGFTTNIRQPIINYLTGVSGIKPIRYIVMMMDIPTRVSDTINKSVPYQISNAYRQLGLRNGTDYKWKNSHFTLGEFQENTALVSYINFANYADCTGYIGRISQGQTGIYLTGNGGNTGYYFDDANTTYSSYPTWVSGRYLRPLLNEFPATKYVYKTYGTPYITTGDNVAGFCTWGAHAGRGAFYAINGQVQWGGTNNWYILTTIESYNGCRNSSPQGGITGWFGRTSWGSINYEKCPVGAVGHVEEPGLGGVANTGFYLLWQRGWPLIECAWESRSTDYFLCVGDPLICI